MLAPSWPVGPDYFNQTLNEKLDRVVVQTDLPKSPFNECGEESFPFNEMGLRESMSLYDFLVRSEGIANSLKGRVKEFQFRMECDKGYLAHNLALAKSLLDQYDRFKKSKEKAEKAIAELKGRLRNQSQGELSENDHALILLCADKIIGRLSQIISKLEKDYLTPGTICTYLADRVNQLQAAYLNLTQGECLIEVSTKHDSSGDHLGAEL